MRQLHLRFAAVYRDLESKSIPQVEMMSSRSWWFEGESWENCMLFVICAISFNKNHCRRRFFNFSVAVLIRGRNFILLMKTNENNNTYLIRKLFTYLFYVSLGNSSAFRGWTKSVCSFYTSKLLFRRNNRIWRKGIACKVSIIASHQTRWYIKRMLTKGYSVPRDISWIENYDWYDSHLLHGAWNFCLTVYLIQPVPFPMDKKRWKLITRINNASMDYPFGLEACVCYCFFPWHNKKL